MISGGISPKECQRRGGQMENGPLGWRCSAGGEPIDEGASTPPEEKPAEDRYVSVAVERACLPHGSTVWVRRVEEVALPQREVEGKSERGRRRIFEEAAQKAYDGVNIAGCAKSRFMGIVPSLKGEQKCLEVGTGLHDYYGTWCPPKVVTRESEADGYKACQNYQIETREPTDTFLRGSGIFTTYGPWVSESSGHVCGFDVTEEGARELLNIGTEVMADAETQNLMRHLRWTSGYAEIHWQREGQREVATGTRFSEIRDNLTAQQD